MYDIKCNTSIFVITITSSSLLIYTFEYTHIKCSKRLVSIIAHINSYTRSGYTSLINQSLLYKSDKSDNEAFTHCMMCVCVCRCCSNAAYYTCGCNYMYKWKRYFRTSVRLISLHAKFSIATIYINDNDPSTACKFVFILGISRWKYISNISMSM